MTAYRFLCTFGLLSLFVLPSTSRSEGAISYGVPHGILVPKGWQNLWVAGRCNSSDVRVHGSIRVGK